MLGLLLPFALAQDVCHTPASCEFDSIQQAIDSVPAGGNRTLVVEAGIWNETLRVEGGRTISLIAPITGFDPVIITVTEPTGDAVITVVDSKLVLTGMAIDGNLVRGIDATNSEISIYLSSVFGRGLGSSGGLIQLNGGELRTTLVTLDGGTVGSEGGLISAINADVDLLNTSLTNGAASKGGGLAMITDEPHTLALNGAVFRDCSAGIIGGALYVEGEVAISGAGVVVQRGSAVDGGGVALVGEGVVMDVQTIDLSDNFAFGHGGALYLSGADLSVENAVIIDNQGTNGGAVWMDAGRIDLTSALFEGNQALDSGGAAHITAGEVRQIDTGYLRNSAVLGSGGGLHLGAGSVLASDVRGVYCSNTAAVGGGLYSELANDTVLHNTRFLDNVGLEDGGAIAHRGSGALTLNFANLLGNTAGRGSGAAVLTSGPLALTDALVGWSLGAVAVVERDNGEVELLRTAWWANERGDLEGLQPGGAIFDDPLLDRFVPGDACEVVQDWPALASPLTGQGDPVLNNPDGKPASRGAFGGPLADPLVWGTDEDQDGSPRIYDCDDGNAAVRPGAEDTPYDGLDSDCDQGDDFDDDRDGFRALDYGGTDCDDDDVTSYPGAEEFVESGVDNNCDGILDADLDGIARPDDCDDTDPLTYPDAPDDSNQVDRNCDGVIDGPRVFQPVGCDTGAGGRLGWIVLGLLALRRR